MGLFGDAHRWGEGGGGEAKKPHPLPKVCHSYPTMVNLGKLIPYVKKIKKYIYKSRDILLEFSWYQQFFRVSTNFAISRNTDIDFILIFWYIVSNSFNFFWVLKDFFKRHGYNFDDVSENCYSSPFQNKSILK